MLATCYLPRGWPPKYFHLCKSLRPCSGWERVVYLRLVTSEFFEYAQNYTRYKLYAFINLLTLSWTIALRYAVVHSILLTQKFHSLRSAILRVRLTDVRRHSTQSSIRKSPRPISNTRLKMLPLLHLCPINVVIYNGTY